MPIPPRNTPCPAQPVRPRGSSGAGWLAAAASLLLALVLCIVADRAVNPSHWQTQHAGPDGLGSAPAVAGDPLASLALDLSEHLAHPGAPGHPQAAPLHPDVPQGATKLAGDDGQGSEPCAEALRSTRPLNTVHHPAPARTAAFASAAPRHADRPPSSSSDHRRS